MEILDNDHTKACGQCRREPTDGGHFHVDSQSLRAGGRLRRAYAAIALKAPYWSSCLDLAFARISDAADSIFVVRAPDALD
jgi:hypothetical protein